jgi:transketolase
MSAGKHRLSNLVLLIDYNKLQSYGPTSVVMDLEPLADKLTSFGMAVREVDGHDVGALRTVLGALPADPARPTAVICHTVKGRGVPFAEGNPEWHHKSNLSDQELAMIREHLV